MKTKMKPSSVIWTAILLGLGIIFSSGCQKQQAGWKGKIEMDIYPQLIFKNGYIYTLARDEAGYSKALRLNMIE